MILERNTIPLTETQHIWASLLPKPLKARPDGQFTPLRMTEIGRQLQEKFILRWRGQIGLVYLFDIGLPVKNVFRQVFEQNFLFFW